MVAGRGSGCQGWRLGVLAGGWGGGGFVWGFGVLTGEGGKREREKERGGMVCTVGLLDEILGCGFVKG